MAATAIEMAMYYPQRANPKPSESHGLSGFIPLEHETDATEYPLTATSIIVCILRILADLTNIVKLMTSEEFPTD